MLMVESHMRILEIHNEPIQLDGLDVRRILAPGCDLGEGRELLVICLPACDVTIVLSARDRQEATVYLRGGPTVGLSFSGATRGCQLPYVVDDEPHARYVVGTPAGLAITIGREEGSNQ